ncbi:hypothetical protein [Ehrlichia ruminantium]|uniref:hypothetical protein n=1 Tax=Ehrlichia ruminantium TaxID=779 RepID=UPI0015DCE306|nr:hypothetical protein [Ehrlichia ruminantium]QLK57697.1 hypothetical protein FDZ59_01520 [Ehrlichia ruminantium]UOD98157.1 hypothetical protein IMW64_01530 [Ehrlichia ruminantium]
MNKKISTALIFILITVLASAIYTYLEFRKKLTNDAAHLGVLIVLAEIALFFVVSIVHRVRQACGFTIKHQIKEDAINIDINTESGIYIPIPDTELPKIGNQYNITEITTKPTKTKLSNTVSIRHNKGLITDTTDKHNSTPGMLLITNERSHNKLKRLKELSGLLITTKSKVKLPEGVKLEQLTQCATTIKKGKVSFLISYIKPFHQDDNLLTYSNEELHYLLTNRAINENTSDSTLSVYDYVLSEILQTCPDIKSNNETDQNPWFRTKEGKIALRFFTYFEDFLKKNKLFFNLPIESKNKFQHIQDYIKFAKTNGKLIITSEYDQNITTIIKNAYFNYSYDINHYSHLWKNRLSRTSNYILKLINKNIQENVMLQLMCTLAVIDQYDISTEDEKTNTVIKTMLLNTKQKFSVEEITNSVDPNTGLIDLTQDYGANPNMTALLRKLAHNDKECTIGELIRRARVAIAEEFKEHMKGYVERHAELEPVKVNKITLLNHKEELIETPANTIDTETIERADVQQHLQPRN